MAITLFLKKFKHKEQLKILLNLNQTFLKEVFKNPAELSIFFKELPIEYFIPFLVHTFDVEWLRETFTFSDLTKLLFQVDRPQAYQLLLALGEEWLNKHINNFEFSLETVELFVMAIINGYEEVVDVLIKAGIDVNLSTKNGNFMLEWAIAHAPISLVEKLIDAGAMLAPDIDPLHIAKLTIANARANAIMPLSKHGIDFISCSKEQASPIVYAAIFGDGRSLSALLKLGLDANSIYDNSSLLSLAVESGDVNCVRLLLEAGADLSYFPLNNCLPYLAVKNDTASIIKCLHEFGVDFDIEVEGMELRMFAAFTGLSTALKALFDLGIDLSKGDKLGFTPLMVAAQNGHIESVELLIECGVDLNCQNSIGVTAAFLAAQNGYTDIVWQLLEKGVDFNIAVNGGVTPIFQAILNGHLSVIKMLVKAGVTLDIPIEFSIDFFRQCAHLNNIESKAEKLITTRQSLNSIFDIISLTPREFAELLGGKTLKAVNTSISKEKSGSFRFFYNERIAPYSMQQTSMEIPRKKLI